MCARARVCMCLYMCVRALLCFVCLIAICRCASLPSDGRALLPICHGCALVVASLCVFVSTCRISLCLCVYLSHLFVDTTGLPHYSGLQEPPGDLPAMCLVTLASPTSHRPAARHTGLSAHSLQPAIISIIAWCMDARPMVLQLGKPLPLHNLVPPSPPS